jgi:hypothetical protein
MNKVIAVHNTFSLNCIFRSGFATSGKIPQNGLITSKNLTTIQNKIKSLKLNLSQFKSTNGNNILNN